MKTIEMMLLDDIKISRGFLLPKEEKMDKCRRYYAENGKLDREIVVNSSGTLIDGYVGYLVLKENGVAVTKVTRGSKKQKIYIAGHHDGNPKEYWWVVSKKTEGMEFAKPGATMVVSRRAETNVATINRVEQLSEPPVSMRMERVIRVLDE